MAHTFVKDVMKKDLIKIESTKTIKDAAKLMYENNVGCVIVTQNDIPKGIVTERDFVRLASQEKKLNSVLSDVMSSPLITIEEDETVWEAAQKMKVNNIHKLPVKSNDDIVGIITTSDLVQICSVGSDSEMRKICDQILLRMQSDTN